MKKEAVALATGLAALGSVDEANGLLMDAGVNGICVVSTAVPEKYNCVEMPDGSSGAQEYQRRLALVGDLVGEINAELAKCTVTGAAIQMSDNKGRPLPTVSINVSGHQSDSNACAQSALGDLSDMKNSTNKRFGKCVVDSSQNGDSLNIVADCDI